MRRGSVGEAIFHDIHGHYCHQSPQPPQHQQQCNSTSCLRRAAATTELCGGAVEWSLSSTAASARGGAIQQQQIFCTNLANSTGVKYTSVLSRVCLCVTVQEGDILLYISSINSAVLLSPVLPSSMLLVSGIPNHYHHCQHHCGCCCCQGVCSVFMALSLKIKQ